MVETYIQGYLPPLVSFEIVGDGVEGTHLYVRTPVVFSQFDRGVFYAQYPNVEIVESPDYVDQVPKGCAES